MDKQKNKPMWAGHNIGDHIAFSDNGSASKCGTITGKQYLEDWGGWVYTVTRTWAVLGTEVEDWLVE